ncbi:hypothetical protein Tco_0119533, partial [Tanacetum coccineum]
VKKLEARVKIGKARRQARVILSDDEDLDDSSKQGRKLSDAEVQEKASTDTELFIQEVTPTEVIQDQKGSEKASDEVSTAGAKKGTTSKEVPIVSTAEVNLSTAGGTVKLDVEELYRLVKEIYSASRQDEFNLMLWRLCDFCGIYILLMENGLAIHMLTEKTYPLSQEMLTKMLSRKLEVDHESSQAFELLRFIRSQVQK